MNRSVGRLGGPRRPHRVFRTPPVTTQRCQLPLVQENLAFAQPGNTTTSVKPLALRPRHG